MLTIFGDFRDQSRYQIEFSGIAVLIMNYFESNILQGQRIEIRNYKKLKRVSGKTMEEEESHSVSSKVNTPPGCADGGTARRLLPNAKDGYLPCPSNLYIENWEDYTTLSSEDEGSYWRISLRNLNPRR